MAWFTDDELRRLAGNRLYERGLDYVEAVDDLRLLPQGVVATVYDGTSLYRVVLRNSGGKLDGQCDCSHGRHNHFCDHCVAVGLNLLHEPTSYLQHTAETIKTSLAHVDHNGLAELIWGHASEDPYLYEQLVSLVMASTSTPDPSVLRFQVERLNPRWMAEVDEETYAERVMALIESIDSILPHQAAAVQPLLRRAVIHVGATADTTDEESDALIDIADTVWGRYLQACEIAPPDSVELARWFVDFQLNGPDIPEVCLDDLIDLLGDEGLRAYADRIEEVTPDYEDHYLLPSIREELIAATGDTDDLIACIAEDLSTLHQYVRIAGLLRADNRASEAITWLERGRTAITQLDEDDNIFVDLLSDLYIDAARIDDAIALHQEYVDATKTHSAREKLQKVKILRETANSPELDDIA